MNERLDKARADRVESSKRSGQIQKLVNRAELDRGEVLDFLRIVIPDACTEEVEAYIENEPIEDITSLLGDFLFLSIETFRRDGDEEGDNT